jgi:hypothetical protein
MSVSPSEQGRGRPPSALTPKIQREICKLIEETACSVYTVALSLDLEWTTIYRWEQWGREGKAPYDEFCTAVMRARAKAEIGLVRGVKEAAGMGNDTAVRANSWLLERRFPHDYGQRVKLEEQLAQLSETEVDESLAAARTRAGAALGGGEGEAAALAAGVGGDAEGSDSLLPADAQGEAASVSGPDL